MKHAVLVSLLFISTLAHAISKMPDRVGNGGGVWVCEDEQATVHEIMFMDVFEARREFQLTVPELEVPPLEAVAALKTWISVNLPAQRKIVEHIDYVETNITWIEDIINQIPDGANKISPHPSLCPQGSWSAVQLVNFTEDFRILVRRELFDSPLFSDLERAAVYLHEGVYSYLRTVDGDTTSVRARAIVGFLLSSLTDAEKVERIQRVLDQEQGGIGEGEEPPAEGFICGLKPGFFDPLYLGEDKNRLRAVELAIEACKEGQNPFGGGGRLIIGPERECMENKVFCEPYVGSQKKRSCTLKMNGDENSYNGVGRTNLEAQYDATARCWASSGSQRCHHPAELTCK